MNVKWEQHKLGGVAKIIGGGTPNTKIPAYWNGTINWYTPVEIGKKIYINESQRKITLDGLKHSSAKLLPKNSVLFTSRAGIGKMAILGEEATTNQGFQSIIPIAKELDSYFLFSLSNQLKYYGETHGAGSTFTEISGKELAKFKLILPKLNEQKIISKLIMMMDKLISLQQRKLEFLKEIKKGLLQKMFADKSKFPILRFEGFHNEWEQRKLKNVYQKIGNAFVGTASPYYVDAGHFYLESNNIKNGQINRNHEVFINNSFYQKQSNKLLHTGDLVMVQSGHVGDTAVITQEYNNSAAHALIMFRNPKDKFLSDYLNFYFQNTSAKNKINVLAIGNTIRHVLASDMSRFSVYFPNKDERKYISNLLLKLQYTITLQQSKISQLTILKKYLLQKLFI
ncbi:restriction endonuclease subunit S [Limosilactobacillus reuteri]|uniref:restriction endonuclease subunit S n=1 Tax=Limosilactobacillus reuteri TaxID=1598 RepID=UPI002B06020F|nr:restriction endonuclease subunit S [Limosilactobacillus reuteri]